MGLNGLNGSSRPMCNSSLSLSLMKPPYTFKFTTHYIRLVVCCCCCCPFLSLSLMLYVSYANQVQIPSCQGLCFSFFFLSCVVAVAWTLLAPLLVMVFFFFFSRLWNMLRYLVNSVFQHLSRSLNNSSTLAYFCFPPPPNLALIIFCSRRISVAYMYVSKTRVERMLRIL
jgi:hypothetical protein